MSAERAVTVLAVDDDASSRRATLRLLRQAGFRTRQAATGDQALSIVTKQRPDLIVLNDDVEGGRGSELSRQIKRLPEAARTPVLRLASAQAPPGTLPEGIDIGVDGCLSQPADPAALLTMINALLRAGRIEQSAAAERAAWQATLEGLHVAVSFVDLEGRILNCNAAFLALVGVAREAAVGRTCREVLSDPVASATEALLERMKSSGRAEATELRVGDRWCAIMMDPVVNAAGNLVGGVHSCLDITDRKAMQEELAHACDEAERRAREAEESKGILDAILEHLPLAMLIVDAPEASVRMVSKYGLETAGHTAETMLGISAEELAEVLPIYHLDGVTQVAAEEMQIVRAARCGEASATQQWVVVRPDGERMTVLSTAGPICDRQGAVIGGVVVWQDITPLTRLQEERARLLDDLKSHRGFLETVLDSTPAAIVYVDRESRYVLVNRAYVAASGRRREDFMGRSILDYFPQPEYRAMYFHVVRTGEPVSGREMPLELPARPEAGVTYWDFTLTPIKNDAGEVEGVLLTAIEVTDKVRARERIAAAERAHAREARLLATIIESMPGLVAYVDRELRYQRASSIYASGLGLTREEIVGKSHAELFAHAPKTTEWLAKARDVGEKLEMREILSVTPLPGAEPGEAWLDVTHTPVRDEKGEVEGVVIFLIDVTDKVKQRELISASERDRAREARMLTTILESVPGMVAYLDRELRYLHVNSQMARAFGLTPGELIGVKHHDGLYPMSPEAEASLARLFLTGKPVVSHRIKPIFPITWRAATEYDAFDISVIPVRDDGGNVEGMVVFVADVTEAVAQREMLLETERARCQLAETLNEEINHRVKNNLMMVVGLLQMQMVQETDPRVTDALHDAMTRLLIFASVHDQLRFGPAEEIDLLEGVRRIADVTRSAFTGARVDLTVSGDSAPCPAPPATPILVIVNELLTNAIRHGAPEADGRQHVECSLSAADGTLRLSVWSSGNPLPEDFDPSTQTTLGLRLVWDVVVTRHLGTFTLRPDRGGNLAEIALDYQRLRQDL